MIFWGAAVDHDVNHILVAASGHVPTRRSPMRLLPARWCRLLAAGLCAVALSSCKVDLYTNLDQRQANEMVAMLLRHGIAADRAIGKGDRIRVAVEEARFAEAIAILSENGLPKQEFATLGEVFKKDGLVSSPVQERAQMIFALSQELSRTVSDIDGVISARVHLVLPENDPLRQQLVPSSASVFIRHHADMALVGLVPQVKMLVANGVAGLSYDKVSVILVPVETHEPPPMGPHATIPDIGLGRDDVLAGWPIYGGVSAVLIGGAMFGFFRWRQRQRVYPLPLTDPGSSS
jgi:type III secretion protein J